MTVSIDIGEMTNGQQAGMDLEELLATRLLVQGNSGSGKSHLLRRLLEQHGNDGLGLPLEHQLIRGTRTTG